MFIRRFNFLTFAGIKIGIDISWFFIAILLTWTLADGYFPYYYPGLLQRRIGSWVLSECSGCLSA